ncbi:MAG: carbon-nitrogen hydrolase, partial [Bacteroidales bacterium]|nr:carbon-nitrogen hydrolase [Bacteroidales bacterium]
MKKKDLRVNLRNLQLNDYIQLREAMQQVYTSMNGLHWEEEQIQELLNIFPEGQLCIEVNGLVVACALSLIIDHKQFGDNHTYTQITGNYTFNTHNPNGDVLYGI